MEANWTDETILRELQSPVYAETSVDAWNHLVSLYNDPLKRRANWEINKREDYVSFNFQDEDAVQNVWIKAFERIDQCEGNIRGWLFTILINHIRDEARKKRLETHSASYSLDEELNNDGFTGLDNAESSAMDRTAFSPDYSNLGIVSHNLEETVIDESVEARIQILLRKFLTNSETGFLMTYREDTEAKTAREKTRFHRLKIKLGDKMISDWVASGNSLDDLMPPRQSNILRAKYSLKQRDAEIFKNFNLSDKSELESLLSEGFQILFDKFLEMAK